ncbi:ribose-5-phosphate isomerase [Sinomonas halotolerans]|uniref:Ribose-5-phosphate isomerase n=1 Tax=Sinomonas halotolerans TaxID=1644133 RepID=A0ABU9X3D8_9MICC
MSGQGTNGESTGGLRVVIGSDEAGVDYKDAVLADLERDGRIAEVIDIGVARDGEDFTRPYPYVGIAAGQMISEGRADRAILFCGTGLGVAIAANKIPGIRAATAHDSFSVERSVLSNNCQVLTMGQRVIGLELARRLAKEWLGYTFDPGSASASKVKVLSDFEGC